MVRRRPWTRGQRIRPGDAGCTRQHHGAAVEEVVQVEVRQQTSPVRSQEGQDLGVAGQLQRPLKCSQLRELRSGFEDGQVEVDVEGCLHRAVRQREYRGSYELIQTIKIDKDRLNINKETGQIIEFDPWWREDGVPGMEGVGVFARLDYSWKDPDEYKKLDDGSQDPEGLTSAKVSAMKKKIRKFEDVLYGTNVTSGSARARGRTGERTSYTSGDPTTGRRTSISTRRSTTTWSRSSPRTPTRTCTGATSSTPTTSTRRPTSSSWVRCGTSTAVLVPGTHRPCRPRRSQGLVDPREGQASTTTPPDPLVHAADRGSTLHDAL